ncbi:MAG TPA: sporulation transcription factor Spo0A [Clostridiaceae bacterium]|nr:sporulation transcription factor Spo0A [Clostridiaceae bacterium]
MTDMISVLIVDDNVEFGNLMHEYMNQQKDIKVVGVALDGLQAIEMIKAFTPDVVILDIIMPNLDGIGVLENVSEMQLKPKPIFIVLSALNQDGLIQKTISLGADYYIVKPFDLNVLISRIRQIYSEKRKIFPVYSGIVSEGFSQDNNEQMTVAKKLEIDIAKLLKTLGISPHMTGYKYLKEAVKLSLKDSGKARNSVTKVIYPAVAEKFSTTPQKVERAIRNAIECAWNRGNPQGLEEVYGCQMSFRRGKPTNSQFIAMVSDRLRIMGIKNVE